MRLVRIIHVDSRLQVDQAKALFIEYAESMDIDLGFQGFDDELSHLPGAYAPSARGSLLLAVDHEAGPVGCVALRQLDERTCEMKRLFVKPGFTGRGLGRKLAEAVIHEAQSKGYGAMRLDTLSSMTPAVCLYRSLGFRPINAYRFNPIDNALYMERSLSGGGPTSSANEHPGSAPTE